MFILGRGRGEGGCKWPKFYHGWMNDVKKRVGSCQVTRILENIDFGAVLHSRIIIILSHIMSGFNWYARYEPTDMHIPCCHNPLLSVAKLLLQKLSVWERERERERARVVFPVLCCGALAISRWSHVGALMSFLSFCFIFWSADELLLIRTRRGAIPGTSTASMQLLFVFAAACFVDDSCSWPWMVFLFLLLSWSSVRDLLQLMDPGFGAWSSIPQLLLREA